MSGETRILVIKALRIQADRKMIITLVKLSDIEPNAGKSRLERKFH